jgi:two-component system, chemotaxis family, protein-glutamate methylesterase/glutaminase
MPNKHLVVIGASAGGIEALRELVAALPPDFPAPIAVVLHSSPQSPGVLDTILSRSGPLPASNARDREWLKPGHIYVAPPDFHMLIEPGIVRVTKGPRENRFRPAIDPLFRSAGQVYGPAAIGVVLTGNLDDSTAGLWAIKQLGGIAIVQDPEDAMFPDMPRNALAHVRVDHTLPLLEIAPLLVRLTAQPPQPAEIPVSEALEVEVKIAKEDNAIAAGIERIAEPSKYACPECHGVLLELKEGNRVRFRCHTGHAYSMESLLAAVSEGIEESLWIAIRSLEEGRLLLCGIAAHVKSAHKDSTVAKRLLERADEAREQSEAIRKLVVQREPLAVQG